MKDKIWGKLLKKRLPLFVILVAMIFAILLVSMAISGIVSFFLLTRSIK